jgi:WD40 repeat protein
MCSLRFILIAVFGLFSSVPWLMAEEPGKLEETPSGFKLIRTLRGHTSFWTKLNFSSDGKLLTSTGDTTIRLWDTATGKEIRKREMDGELWYAGKRSRAERDKRTVTRKDSQSDLALRPLGL